MHSKENNKSHEISSDHFDLTFSSQARISQQNYEWAFTTKQYDRCNDFSDGLAIVKIGYERGYINREGKIHIQPHFNIIDTYS